MKVHIKYYAKYRESAGKKEEILEMEPITAGDLLSLLRSRYPEIARDKNSLLAVNNRFGKESVVLSDGDTVLVFPPVSGG